MTERKDCVGNHVHPFSSVLGRFVCPEIEPWVEELRYPREPRNTLLTEGKE